MTPDRAVLVPAGKTIRTGYVWVWDCILDNRERMAVGDIDRAYQRLLQQGNSSQWPFPYGYWEEGKFHIQDGRHEYIASLMLSKEHILVAWLE